MLQKPSFFSVSLIKYIKYSISKIAEKGRGGRAGEVRSHRSLSKSIPNFSDTAIVSKSFNRTLS